MSKHTKEDKRKATTKAKHAAIYAKYMTLKSKKEHGVQVYTHPFCIKECAKQFFMAPDTIESIVLSESKRASSDS